jgi:hypothetical protein
MKACIVSCGIYRPELENILANIQDEEFKDITITIEYLPTNLHVDLKKLKAAVLQMIDSIKADRIILLYGAKCHPEFDLLFDEERIIRFPQANCIELVAGDLLGGFDSRTFYLTTGWMLKWREIFDYGWGVDEVAMRQSFACYDKSVFVDSGICEISDEQLLDFFESSRVPIEVCQGSLENFRNNILSALRKAAASVSRDVEV